jgi:hypothetical protein
MGKQLMRVIQGIVESVLSFGSTRGVLETKKKNTVPSTFSTFFEIQFTKALPLGRRKGKGS